MMGADDRSHRGGTKGDVGRAERLAAELRENLKRRKARVRAREEQQLGNAENGGSAAAPETPGPKRDE